MTDVAGVAAARKVLLTGANGQLGWELRRSLAPLGQVVALGRDELELGSVGAIREVVRSARPALVVNAAAYTAVDRAEAEREAAFAINAIAPAVLAAEAARLGAPMVHFSTDYVFDGQAPIPYTEQDAAAPLNVYGESKLAGDHAVAASGAAHLILRTSWVYATRGHNFMRTMLRLAHEREELRVVDDQVGAPTPAWLIADVTAELLRALAITREDGALRIATGREGTYNVATTGQTSWHGFAARILTLDPDRARQRCRALIPIPTREYPTPAARPARSLLDTAKLAAATGNAPPGWEETLERTMAVLPSTGDAVG